MENWITIRKTEMFQENKQKGILGEADKQTAFTSQHAEPEVSWE